MKKALIVLSGGQDSTTCLFWAIKQGYSCSAITFDYNQLHNIEIESAKKICKIADIDNHEIINIGSIFQGNSPLTNSKRSLETHEDIKEFATGIQKTFVPGRNMLFLSIAANRAYSQNISTVITGVCEEDFGGYPDCRQDFIDSMETTIGLALEREIEILAPLMSMKKFEIVKLAKSLDETCWKALAYTHTSYDGKYPPSSNDHANMLRSKAFEEANLPDPLVLRAVSEKLMPLPKSKNYETKNK